jgi:2-oxoisovalerate dehydrogenase E1 component
MTLPRAKLVDKKFLDFLAALPNGSAASKDLAKPVRAGTGLTAKDALDLFESQVISRHLDIVARRLKAENKGYYTIGSTGHEGNAVLGALLRTTDPCLLHYRSGALMIQRAKHIQGEDPVRDICLSFVAAADEPVSGGRHKVWGSKRLNVPPQTSTIASHPPRATGMALAVERANRLKLPLEIPSDSIVAASFGDASANHSTLLGGVNTAIWHGHQGLPCPVLFVCEDNGIGISVPTPTGWIEANWSHRPGLKYFKADGTDLPSAWDAAKQAIDFCRSKRAPVFLHLEMVRLLGHAGTDMEGEYLSPEEMDANESRDPLLRSAKLLVENGWASPADLRSLYEKVRTRVEAEAERALGRPKIATAEEVVRPLAPFHGEKVAAEAARSDYGPARLKLFGSEEALPENHPKPRHLAMMISWALGDLLAKYPEMVVFGEDVAKKGGVYYVTQGLLKLAGPDRVFNTLLDETSIFGMALGAGQVGQLPCPEIQYLAYYHNAEDQVRGEACSQQFFSNGQFRNPMVARIASFAYQKGFGGHFHNDNSIAALRDIPGLVVASPSRGDDAVGMLRTCFAMAKTDGRVVAFLEPIARYMTKDLYAEGDGLWQFKFPAPGSAVPFGEGRVYADGSLQDLTIITYANGVYLALRAAKKLSDEHGIRARVLDLRWLNPLNKTQIAEEALKTGRVLILDECRRTGGLGEGVEAALMETLGAKAPPLVRLAAEDTYIPLADAANLVLPSEEAVVREALKLVE